MTFHRAILMAAALLAPLAAPAEVFRCVVPGGSVSYQQQPCDADARGGAVAIPASYPDHTEARDRLAAREAAAPVYFVGRPLRGRDTRGASGTPRSRPRT